MKTNVLLAIAITVVTSLTANAQWQATQPYLGKSPREVKQVMRPEEFISPATRLDDKQREEIKKIRTEQVKERTQTHNLLKEKHAKLELLQTSDKPDMKEINQVIDEIAAIQAQAMKTKAAGRQKIRSLLTEEQRVYIDAQGARGDKMRAGRKGRVADGNRFRKPGGERLKRTDRSNE